MGKVAIPPSDVEGLHRMITMKKEREKDEPKPVKISITDRSNSILIFEGEDTHLRLTNFVTKVRHQLPKDKPAD